MTVKLLSTGGFAHSDQGVWGPSFHGSDSYFRTSEAVHGGWIFRLNDRCSGNAGVFYHLTVTVYFVQHLLQPSVVSERCRHGRGRACFLWSLLVVKAEQSGSQQRLNHSDEKERCDVVRWVFCLVADVHLEGFGGKCTIVLSVSLYLPFSVTACPALSVTGV